VIRAGIGITDFHGGGTGNNGTGVSPGQLGYNASASFSSATTGQPAFYWAGGVPPYQQPPFINPGYGAGFTTASPTSAVTPSYVPPNIGAKPPYSDYFNFGIQHQITPTMTLGIAYAGNSGHFLLGNAGVGNWTNSMPIQDLALGALLGVQATPANIAAAQAIIPGVHLPFANFQGTIAQMLKPYPQYAGITYLWGNRGNSSYNSLQVTMDHRLSSGLNFHFGYVYSKEIDDLGSNRNPYAGYLDRALGTIDHPHVFTASIYYALPFGANHAMGGQNPIVRALVSNWILASLITFQSGAPITITGSGCVDTGITSTCVASYNPAFNGNVRINGNYGSGNALAPGPLSYLNPAAFVDPAPYTFGNLPRTAPFGLLAPYTLDEDLTVRREVFLHERMKLVFEANIFNITNSVNFGAPGTNIDSATFGEVTSQKNLPRKVQFNARFSF
jgi:hypothetical protein